jgi:hypothetical protein
MSNSFISVDVWRDTAMVLRRRVMVLERNGYSAMVAVPLVIRLRSLEVMVFAVFCLFLLSAVCYLVPAVFCLLSTVCCMLPHSLSLRHQPYTFGQS